MARGRVYLIEGNEIDKETDTTCYHDGLTWPCSGQVFIAIGYPGWPKTLFLCEGHRSHVGYGPEYKMRPIIREVLISGEDNG